jgi:hypothetical protein
MKDEAGSWWIRWMVDQWSKFVNCKLGVGVNKTSGDLQEEKLDGN